MSKHNVAVMLNMYRSKGVSMYRGAYGELRWSGLGNLTRAQRAHALGLDTETVLEAMKMQGVL